MRKVKTLFLSLLISFSASTIAQTTIYTNDMDYVIGDAKQACIQNKLTTPAKVDALIAGFKAMKCNGIRVPIFPTGLNPNEPMMALLIQRAKEEGLVVFANPAQHGGATRIANESWEVGGVKGDPVKTQILIDRILEFDKKYPCKWVDPFNEDSKTGAKWTAEQMNIIYSTIKDSLVNAELIGPCTWGLSVAIDIFKNTNIKDYITVATSHNLSFTHSKWKEFIDMAHAEGLPVWDSEITHSFPIKNDVKITVSRLQAALANKVDGLVIYNLWRNINLTTGAINNGGKTMMSLYLKPASTGVTTTSIKNADVYHEDYGFRVEFLTTAQNNSVKIMDITGKIIQQYSHISDNDLQIRNLKQGLYIVVISSNNQTQVEKVMVY
ncbi:T9SS type A sorting domain-containing protein [bacterium]|nr:T9SS type A sorting domain-containing protein [bacterium]